MKNIKYLTLVTLSLIASFSQAHADEKAIPAAIKQNIAALEQDCHKEAGSNDIFLKRLDAIKGLSLEEKFKEYRPVDLNKDGETDYIVNASSQKLSCGFRYGITGEGMVIFMNINGAFKKVYDGEVYTFSVGEDDVTAVFEGKKCGEGVSFSRCERKVVWNDETKEIGFGEAKEY